MSVRFKQKYTDEVAPALQKEFGYTSPMAIPKIACVKLNMGLGEAISNSRLMDAAVEELGAIAGQRPVVTKAKKSIAAFKLREGMPIGCMVSLRGDRMYEFLDRLISIACRGCAIFAACRRSRSTAAATTRWEFAST
jgi:large subunit ribosomal protein L5